MGIKSRTGNRQDDRAALRALYMNILVSTIGLAAYDVQDDANLDTLDVIVANLYARRDMSRGVKGDTGVSGPATMPAAAPLAVSHQPEAVPTEDEVEQQVQFRTSDPEPA